MTDALDPALPNSVSASSADSDSHQPHARTAMDMARTFLTAMILAFIFRAFLVEAFIIPTGSMAPGLLGAHRAIICADCGMEYDISAAERPFAQPSATIRVRCPNCLN
ncbi:MAG: S26 family signal peptidase, partial [Phycisphaerales bacterium]|nr:S26 family signal peptidase [Phycisphaerales bacterium]